MFHVELWAVFYYHFFDEDTFESEKPTLLKFIQVCEIAVKENDRFDHKESIVKKILTIFCS